MNAARPPAFWALAMTCSIKRGFAGGFRAENLDHPSARNAADAQGEVHGQRAGGDDLDLLQGMGVAQAHDAAFAIGLGDGRNGGIEFPLAGGGEARSLGGFGVGRLVGGLLGGFIGSFLRFFSSFRWHKSFLLFV